MEVVLQRYMNPPTFAAHCINVLLFLRYYGAASRFNTLQIESLSFFQISILNYWTWQDFSFAPPIQTDVLILVMKYPSLHPNVASKFHIRLVECWTLLSLIFLPFKIIIYAHASMLLLCLLVRLSGCRSSSVHNLQYNRPSQPGGQDIRSFQFIWKLDRIKIKPPTERNGSRIHPRLCILKYPISQFWGLPIMCDSFFNLCVYCVYWLLQIIFSDHVNIVIFPIFRTPCLGPCGPNLASGSYLIINYNY